MSTWPRPWYDDGLHTLRCTAKLLTRLKAPLRGADRALDVARRLVREPALYASGVARPLPERADVNDRIKRAPESSCKIPPSRVKDVEFWSRVSVIPTLVRGSAGS